MAAVNTPRSLLLLLLAFLHIATTLGAVAFYEKSRLAVPVHHGGEQIVAEDRIGQIQRQGERSGPAARREKNYFAYILPALAIAGLSLLFPNIVTVDTAGRRRRDIGSEAPVAALTEHLMNVYYAAIESDQCMQRLACELGAASISLNPHHHNLMLQVLGSTTSNKYSGLFDKFKAGVNAEKCKKYGCSLMDNH
ncbi:uncharacterized protein LOC121853908 isoform X2 [Homarus americanus]|uniref:uncharacterized protein LOC121853908 isoform X2 n=1 Tax=Homarus americanus TaxID=6706 RepID=UPI001C448473|nr:uncharacterized protein LOC121853908 isoform X2 [Homarus americanus]